jgi:hypothetical protein
MIGAFFILDDPIFTGSPCRLRERRYAFFTNSDFSFIAPSPSILQSML